ncbi:hypothetical protein VCUG_02040, partial [Vavraia culicis subsp. floridensis]
MIAFHRIMLLVLHFVLLLPALLSTDSGTKNDEIGNSLEEAVIKQANDCDTSYFYCNPDEISFNIVLHNRKDEEEGTSVKNEVVSMHDVITNAFNKDKSVDVDRNKKRKERWSTINNLV